MDTIRSESKRKIMKNFVTCLTLLAAHFSALFGQTVIANYTQQIDHLAIAHEGNVIWLAASGDGVLKCALDGNVLERYTIANGLIGNTVYDILLDQQGRRWFATDGGISVLDATEAWTQHPFIVKAFAQTPNGDIWAAGNNYTYKLDAATGAWATFAHNGSFGLEVKIAPDNTVFVGGKTGLAVRNPVTLEWAYFRTFTEDPDGNTDYHPVADFEWDAEGNLWVIKDWNLFTFFNGVFTPVAGTLVNDLPNAAFALPVALEKMPNGNLLIGTWNGLWMYDGTPTIQEFKSRPGFRAAFDFAVDNDSTLWFGSELGFSFFDGANFEHYFPDNHTLASENIQKILIDTDNKKWFLGTHAKSQFDNTLWTSPHPNSIVDFDASFESDGSKWFVSASNSVTNLVRLRNDSITVFPGSATGLSFYTRLSWDPIQQRTIFKGTITDNVFWYCKNDSFQSFSITQSLSPCTLSWGNGGELRRFFIAPDGNLFWANSNGYAYTHHGFSFDLGKDTTVYSCGDRSYLCAPPYSYQNCSITNYVAFDSAGNNWYASNSGVYVFSHPGGGISALHYFTSFNSGLPNDTVQCIVFDPIGNAWIGTRNGLAILDVGLNWTILNTSNSNLAGNNIYSIVFDTDGSAWVGTETGVSHLTSTTGTTEVPQKTPGAFRVFPNPVTSGSSLTVEMDLKRAGKLHFDLMDATGKTVRTFSFSEKTIGNQIFNLKTTSVPVGIYFLTARLEGQVLGTQKVILK